MTINLFFKDFLYLFLERGERREKEVEKHGLVDPHTQPDQGPNPQPRHVP